MKRTVSFYDTKAAIVLSIGSGKETLGGVLSLPLSGRYIIEQIICNVEVNVGYGYLSFRSGDSHYTDSVAGESFSRGSFDGYISLVANDGSFELYQQNEISGSGFDNFAASNKLIYPFNELYSPKQLFSGQELDIDIVVLTRLMDSANLTDPQLLTTISYYVNIMLNDQPEDFTKAVKTLKTVRGEERFDFTPKGSSLKFQRK